MHFRTCVGNPTTALLRSSCFFNRQIGKPHYFLVAVLHFHMRIVKASAIYTWRCTGFQPCAFKTEVNQLFGNARSAFLAYPSTAKLLFTYVNNTIKKRAVG